MIAILERLVEQEGHLELADDLAKAYMSKSIAARDLGDDKKALALCDKAIAIWDRLVKRGRGELAIALAQVCSNKADLLIALRDARGAVALFRAGDCRLGDPRPKRLAANGPITWRSPTRRRPRGLGVWVTIWARSSFAIERLRSRNHWFTRRPSGIVP